MALCRPPPSAPACSRARGNFIFIFECRCLAQRWSRHFQVTHALISLCRSSPHPRGAISRAVTRRRLIRQYSVQAQAAVSPFAKPRQDKPAGDSWRRHRARERQHAVDVVPGRCRRRPSSHPVPLLYSTVTACTVYSSRRRAAPTCICEGCSLQYLRLHSAVKTASSCDRPLAPFCRALSHPYEAIA